MIGTILVLDALRHSHFPVSFGVFDRVLLSPHMHQLHHGYKVEHWDKNFGNKLSIWDWWFGTMVAPRRAEEIPVGLGKPEEQEYTEIFGVYVLPLVKIARLLRGQDYSGAKSDKPFFERVLWRSPRQAAHLQQEAVAQMAAAPKDSMALPVATRGGP
jgi:Fatty acid hydroxylase superfamily